MCAKKAIDVIDFDAANPNPAAKKTLEALKQSMTDRKQELDDLIKQINKKLGLPS
jgi:hypothetical protein